jgi:TRAP-type C4-dicarboxylate transport system permease small subunit
MRAIISFVLMFFGFYITWITAMWFRKNWNFVFPFVRKPKNNKQVEK